MRRYPDKGGQFAIIWVDLLYEDAVPASGKLLFGEIYRLSNADGWCDASNKEMWARSGWRLSPRETAPAVPTGAFFAAGNWPLLTLGGYPQKIAGTPEVPAKI